MNPCFFNMLHNPSYKNIGTNGGIINIKYLDGEDLRNRQSKTYGFTVKDRMELIKEYIEVVKEANEKAENAGKMLKKLQSSMGNDYGRWWKRDLHVLLVQAEQEVVEAFSTLAVIKQEEIPPRDILFRSQDPNSYLKTKKYVRVSDEAYVYGLLD